jgi:lysophospholipase L1-like esterase
MATHTSSRQSLAARFCALLIAITGLVAGVIAAPASAAPPGPAAQIFPTEVPDYVALGDSFAAGVGAAPVPGSACGTSPQGYPPVLTQLSNVRLIGNFACKGLTTGQVAAQLADPAVSAALAQAELITLTVGGNDLGVEQIARSCASGTTPAQCQAAIANAGNADMILRMATSYTALLEAIRAKAPNARILVVGYPMFFAENSVNPLIKEINTGTIRLNSLLAGNLLGYATRSGDGNIQFIDIAPAFTGHGIDSLASWINGPSSLPGALHPNAAGYRAGYAAVLAGVLQRFPVPVPAATGTEVPPAALPITAH